MNAAFYCMADERYFLGAVGMINSLRLHGHGEPIFLLDLGLADEQRALLAAEVTLVADPAQAPPWLSKTVAPLAHPADTMVLIDTDVVVTRPLGELIERAATGKVVAFENQVDRHVAEWGDALDLGPIERRRYVSSGVVIAGGEPGAKALRLLDDRQRRVDISRTFYGSDEPGYPFRYPEQDVLNAILASPAVADEAVEELPYRLAPALQPYEGLELVDLDGLRCRYADGAEPYVVHHILPEKPWLEPMYDSIYSRLLKRALVSPGLAIRVPSEMLPLRMRTGPLATLERRRVDAAVRLRWHLGIAVHKARTRVRPAR